MVLLRMLRGTSVGGGHSPLARLVAGLLIVGMLAISAPVLVPMVRWVISLL